MDKLAAIDALKELGLDPPQQDRFFEGHAVVYSLRTEGDPGIAVIEMSVTRLRSGIIEINDVGGGFKDFLRFRSQSRKVAIAMGATELELFGGAIINNELDALLMRHGFGPSIAPIPDELGGGMMEVRTRSFPL